MAQRTLDMRRLITFILVSTLTAIALTAWVNDLEFYETIEPVIAEWNADLLARDAGLPPDSPTTPSTP
jgi:hypothetical protein